MFASGHDGEFPPEDAAKLAMMRKQKTMMMKQLSAKKEFMLMKNHMMVAQEREKAMKEKMEEVILFFIFYTSKIPKSFLIFYFCIKLSGPPHAVRVRGLPDDRLVPLERVRRQLREGIQAKFLALWCDVTWLYNFANFHSFFFSRRKFRQVKRFPSNGGRECPAKMERRQKCECANSSADIMH